MRRPFSRALHWMDRVFLGFVMGAAALVLERAVVRTTKRQFPSAPASAHIEHQPAR